MTLFVIIGAFVALVALLIGAQKFRDRNRYKGEPTIDTDGHHPVVGPAVGRTENPALLGQKSETMGMGFPGAGGAQGPGQ